ncbi:MAG: Bug family tripartite tricarboxylate transporter substrate binding protein [Burkholderiales bacterium]
MRHLKVSLACAATAAALTCVTVHAQSYPTKLVKFVVTYPGGGSSDVMARIIGQKLTDMWGQQCIVESKPGAAGAIGMEYAAKQPADGYTMLLGNFGPVVANPLLQKVNYDVQKDFVPVTMITVGANILVVNPSSPAKSTKELIAIAKAQPGKTTFGTSGAGSMSHLAGEWFKRAAAIDSTAVNYKGGSQWITELMGGQISMVIADAAPAMPNIKSGKVRGLAVTSAKRSPFTPELPTFIEEGLKGFEAVNWWGILFPRGVPRPVIDKVNADMIKVLAMADVKEKLAVFGVEPISSTPEQFGKYMDTERAKWGKLIKEANIRLD